MAKKTPNSKAVKNDPVVKGMPKGNLKSNMPSKNGKGTGPKAGPMWDQNAKKVKK